MAFQNSAGAVASIDDFLDELMDFAVANGGYTRLADDTGGSETVFSLSKVGDATTWWGFQFNTISANNNRQSTTRVEAKMFSVAPTSSNFYDNNGQDVCTVCGLYDQVAPFTSYTFYETSGNIFALLEVSPEVFTSICFGKITGFGTYTFGEFLTATSCYFDFGAAKDIDFDANNPGINVSWPFQASNQITSSANFTENGADTKGGFSAVRVGSATSDNDDYVRMAFETRTDIPVDGYWGSVPPASTQPFASSTWGGTKNQGLMINLFDAIDNTPTLRSPLLPIYVGRTSPTETYSTYIAGWVEGIRIVNLNNFATRDITSDNWRVFPIFQSTGDTSIAPNSFNFGLAFLEVV